MSLGRHQRPFQLDKPTVVALRESAEGLTTRSVMDEPQLD